MSRCIKWRAAALMTFVPVSVFAQTIEKHVEAAGRAESAREFKVAAAHYDSAYRVSGFDPVMLAVAGASLARAGDMLGAFGRVRDAMKAGYVDEAFFRHVRLDSSLRSLRRHYEWPGFDRDVEKHLAAIDTTLRNELLDLERRDQDARSEVNSLVQRFGAKSPQADSAWKAIGSSDAPRIRRLLEIIEATGWPGSKRVGDEAAHAAWLVLQHADSAVQARVFPIVEKASARREARKSDVALLEDRLLVARGQPQRYGSQFAWPDSSGASPTLRPIEKPECVDVRRAAVGLEALTYSVARFGATFDVPQRKRC